ncbi:hypothetical protein T484DRAFT_1923134 [Baffinella frigidus]|nr:hypothetical protein T484DRAFT_1923134 [Cryptophyta sp. CCMP2293]
MRDLERTNLKLTKTSASYRVELLRLRELIKTSDARLQHVEERVDSDLGDLEHTSAKVAQDLRCLQDRLGDLEHAELNGRLRDLEHDDRRRPPDICRREIYTELNVLKTNRDGIYRELDMLQRPRSAYVQKSQAQRVKTDDLELKWLGAGSPGNDVRQFRFYLAEAVLELWEDLVEAHVPAERQLR